MCFRANLPVGNSNLSTPLNGSFIFDEIGYGDSSSTEGLGAYETRVLEGLARILLHERYLRLTGEAMPSLMRGRLSNGLGVFFRGAQNRWHKTGHSLRELVSLPLYQLRRLLIRALLRNAKKLTSKKTVFGALLMAMLVWICYTGINRMQTSLKTNVTYEYDENILAGDQGYIEDIDPSIDIDTDAVLIENASRMSQGDSYWSLSEGWEIDTNGKGAWPSPSNSLHLSSVGASGSAMTSDFNVVGSDDHVLEAFVNIEHLGEGAYVDIVLEQTAEDGEVYDVRLVRLDEVGAQKLMIPVTLLSEAVQAKLRIEPAKGEGVVVDAYFDNFRFCPVQGTQEDRDFLNAKHIIWTADDGWEEQLRMARILNEHGMRLTVSIIPGLVGTQGYLSEKQLLELSKIADIAAHNYDYDDVNRVLDSQEWGYQVEQSRGVLENEFDVNVNVYTLSGGVPQEAAEPFIFAQYPIQLYNDMSAYGRIEREFAFPFNTMLWPRTPVIESGSDASGIDYLDRMFSLHNTITLNLHKFSNNPRHDTEISEDYFMSVVELVEEKRKEGYVVTTPQEIYEAQQRVLGTNLIPNPSFGESDAAEDAKAGWSAKRVVRSIADLIKAFYVFLLSSHFVLRIFTSFFYRPPSPDKYYPDVTFVTPSYREGRAVKETLLRVFATGYPPEKIKIVAINDGSKISKDDIERRFGREKMREIISGFVRAGLVEEPEPYLPPSWNTNGEIADPAVRERVLYEEGFLESLLGDIVAEKKIERSAYWIRVILSDSAVRFRLSGFRKVLPVNAKKRNQILSVLVEEGLLAAPEPVPAPAYDTNANIINEELYQAIMKDSFLLREMLADLWLSSEDIEFLRAKLVDAHETWDYIREAYEIYPDSIIPVNFRLNQGKREGLYVGYWVAAAVELAQKNKITTHEQADRIIAELAPDIRKNGGDVCADAFEEATRKALLRIADNNRLSREVSVSVHVPEGQEDLYEKPETVPEDAYGTDETVLGVLDSDSYMTAGTIRNLVAMLSNPYVGGVAGNALVANADKNLLTAMQAIEYNLGFGVVKKSESVLRGIVSCISGCLGAYKLSLVLPVSHGFVKDPSAKLGDDRNMTNRMLAYLGQEIKYAHNAVVATEVPENLSQLKRQRVRWRIPYSKESRTPMREISKRNIIGSYLYFVQVFLVFSVIFFFGYYFLAEPIMLVLSSCGIDGMILLCSRLLSICVPALVLILLFMADNGLSRKIFGGALLIPYGFYSSVLTWRVMFKSQNSGWGTRDSKNMAKGSLWSRIFKSGKSGKQDVPARRQRGWKPVRVVFRGATAVLAALFLVFFLPQIPIAEPADFIASLQEKMAQVAEEDTVFSNFGGDLLPDIHNPDDMVLFGNPLPPSGSDPEEEAVEEPAPEAEPEPETLTLSYDFNDQDSSSFYTHAPEEVVAWYGNWAAWQDENVELTQDGQLILSAKKLDEPLTVEAVNKWGQTYARDFDYSGAQVTFNQPGGYGRYVFRMKPDITSGAVASLHLLTPYDPETGFLEFDIEITGKSSEREVTYVEFVIHEVNPSGQRSTVADNLYLEFDPSVDFHDYIIEIQPDRVVFYVDDMIGADFSYTVTDPRKVPDDAGMIVRANHWVVKQNSDGMVAWAGAAPKDFEDSVLYIDEVSYTAYDMTADFTHRFLAVEEWLPEAGAQTRLENAQIMAQAVETVMTSGLYLEDGTALTNYRQIDADNISYLLPDDYPEREEVLAVFETFFEVRSSLRKLLPYNYYMTQVTDLSGEIIDNENWLADEPDRDDRAGAVARALINAAANGTMLSVGDVTLENVEEILPEGMFNREQVLADMEAYLRLQLTAVPEDNANPAGVSLLPGTLMGTKHAGGRRKRSSKKSSGTDRDDLLNTQRRFIKNKISNPEAPWARDEAAVKEFADSVLQLFESFSAVTNAWLTVPFLQKYFMVGHENRAGFFVRAVTDSKLAEPALTALALITNQEKIRTLNKESRYLTKGSLLTDVLALVNMIARKTDTKVVLEYRDGEENLLLRNEAKGEKYFVLNIAPMILQNLPLRRFKMLLRDEISLDRDLEPIMLITDLLLGSKSDKSEGRLKDALIGNFLLLTANGLLEKGKPLEAEEVMKRAIIRMPYSPDLLYALNGLANIHIKTGNYERAVSNLESSLDLARKFQSSGKLSPRQKVFVIRENNFARALLAYVCYLTGQHRRGLRLFGVDDGNMVVLRSVVHDHFALCTLALLLNHSRHKEEIPYVIALMKTATKNSEGSMSRQSNKVCFHLLRQLWRFKPPVSSSPSPQSVKLSRPLYRSLLAAA